MRVRSKSKAGRLARRWLVWWAMVWLLPAPGAAQQSPGNLGEMSIEQLLQVKVVSAAKKEQSLVDTAAAVYVVTQEEIRRSGVSSVPEALRLAPGVEVGRISGNVW